MNTILSDVRLSLRRARKRPGFTIVALLSLTLGIGANTAVFSLVNAILLRHAPIPHPEQIAEVYPEADRFPLRAVLVSGLRRLPASDRGDVLAALDRRPSPSSRTTWAITSSRSWARW